MPSKYYESQKRWNAANYKQINIAVRPELCEAFRSACEGNNVPMREVLVSFMSEYASMPISPKQEKDYSERRRRRSEVKAIASQLQEIQGAEERYKENISENLKGSIRFTASKQAVEALEEAITLLNDAFN